MNSDPSATGLHVMLQSGHLLGVGQYITGGVQEYDCCVLRQVGVVELGGILGGIDREIVGGTQLLDSGNAVGDGGVAETGSGGEDKDFESGWLGLENCWNREICEIRETKEI